MAVYNKLQALAQERITVDNTVGGVALTQSNFTVPPLAQTALILVESASIRYLANGTAPTSSTGILAYNGDKIELHHPGELFRFRAIRTGASSATIQVEYFG